ncbi:MAG: head-tail connector protein [Eubacteriales bacterium]
MELTLQDVKDYLCIDFEDEVIDRTLSRLMKTADAYLISSIGEGYPREDEKSKQLALLIIDDLFDNRSANSQATMNTRKIVNDFSMQLRLELQRKEEDEETTTNHVTEDE